MVDTMRTTSTHSRASLELDPVKDRWRAAARRRSCINEGEVYRFFLKPCNPTDLITTIQQAIDHKRLEGRSHELLREFPKQAAMLDAVERQQPGLLSLDLDESGAIFI